MGTVENITNEKLIDLIHFPVFRLNLLPRRHHFWQRRNINIINDVIADRVNLREEKLYVAFLENWKIRINNAMIYFDNLHFSHFLKNRFQGINRKLCSVFANLLF